MPDSTGSQQREAADAEQHPGCRLRGRGWHWDRDRLRGKSRTSGSPTPCEKGKERLVRDGGVAMYESFQVVRDGTRSQVAKQREGGGPSCQQGIHTGNVKIDEVVGRH